MLVSVIIPTRDRPTLLARALESIRAQEYRPVEIVVVDNMGTPPLPATIPAAGDMPHRVVRSEKRLTAAQARNLGIDHARGALICFLDDDDTYLPGKLSDVVAAFNADPALDFCYGDTIHMGPEGTQIGHSAGECAIEPYLRWRYIHCNALAIQRRIIGTYRFDTNFETYEDVDFAGRLVRDLRGKHIPRDHAAWHRDGRTDQLTKRNWRRAWKNWKRLCEKFAPQISEAPELRRFYHRKMFLLAAMFLDFRQMAQSIRILTLP